MNAVRYWGSLMGTTAVVLLSAFALVGGSLAESQPAVHTPQRIVASNTAAQPRGAALPAGLVPIVARTLAQRNPEAWRAHTTKQAVMFNNPAQHLTASFSREGAQLQFGGKQHARLGMQLLALHRGSVSYPITAATPSAHDNRVELNHGHGLTEWYVNSPLGVEQGFTVAAPQKSAASGQSLALVFKLNSNLTPVLKNNALAFQNAKGQTVLRYGNLLAYDALHHALPAQIQLEGSKLLLQVNTKAGRYPLTIDPLLAIVASTSDPNGAAGDDFGDSVALSADGNTALIGAPGVTVSGVTGAGAAYVFSRTNGVWSDKPTASFLNPANSPPANDGFGASVALSGDGTIALIGAPIISVNSVAGAAAYLYINTGTWPTTPSFTFNDPMNQSGDAFGLAVALSSDGSTVLIGAPGATVQGLGFAGTAWIFVKSQGAWSNNTFEQFVTNPVAASAFLGKSVALSGNGSTAVVGASATSVGNSAAVGAAYLYTETNGSWLSNMPLSPSQGFYDPSVTVDGSLGYSVAITSNGTAVLVGAPGEYWVGQSNVVGRALLFTETGGTWSGIPAAIFSDNNSGGSLFGTAVALSNDGSTALIGAPYNGASSQTGVAYLYTAANGVWSTTPSVSLTEPSSPPENQFGYSAALSSDGNTALIGAITADSAGETYFLTPSADLSLALASNPASANVNGNVSYMLTVTNNDTQVTATDLSLTDTLPAGMTYASSAAAGGTCTNTSGTVTCTLPSLVPGATWQPSITVTTTTIGSIKDTASVIGSQFDPNNANNTATVTTAVTPPAPVATNGSVTTTAGTAVNGTLAATGTGPLTFAIVAKPAHGTVNITNAATGAFTYTPASGFSGSDSFTFTASNSSGASNTATETVTVNAASGGGSSGGGSSGGGGGGGAFGLLSLLLLVPLTRLRKRKT